MNIYNEVFKRFGLTIADDKTKTMAFNANEDVASTESLNSPQLASTRLNSPIENVRKSRYLGHTISNIDEMPIRVFLLETYVRSRLLYSVQRRRLNAREVAQLNTIRMNFLRRMVRGWLQQTAHLCEGRNRGKELGLQVQEQ